MSETAPEKKTPIVKGKKKDIIPNMEVAIIFIFFASFIVWAVSKCGVTQAKYEQKALETLKKDTVAATQAIAPARVIAPPPEVVTKTVTKKITVLYIVIDGLKLRNGPNRSSSIIRELKLNEKVDFLDQVTNFKEKINIGDRIAEEPWIKVRSSSGHEGWVYGAGVSYYLQVFQEEVADGER